MNKQKVNNFVNKHEDVIFVIGTAIGISVLKVLCVRNRTLNVTHETHYTLKDLGKLGEDLIKRFSCLTEDTIVDGGHLNLK